ncbi:MAG: SRPBCC family protein [Kovacikia sp.]
MIRYHFVTQWFFRVPIERVWEVIVDSEHWSEWMRDFRRVTVRRLALSGEKVFDIEYRGDLPYSFRFTLTPTYVEAPYRMELDASGQLVGTGCWTLFPKEGGTCVTYVWNVGVTNPIFSLLARLPFIKALTEHNHNATMARAEQALRQQLEDS